jgi:hypothetical protein
MKQLTKTLFASLLWLLSLKAGARAIPVTYLTSVSSSSESYVITFQEGNVTFEFSLREPCDLPESCPAPQATKRAVTVEILNDKTAVDGPKVIDLGEGYQLSIAYNWSTNKKSYNLIPPSSSREDILRFIPMNISFDVQNSQP